MAKKQKDEAQILRSIYYSVMHYAKHNDNDSKEKAIENLKMLAKKYNLQVQKGNNVVKLKPFVALYEFANPAYGYKDTINKLYNSLL